jgi:hypothetical protein
MADLLQILHHTGVKARVTLYADGVATDSATQVKVDVVRPDGTLLVTQANATDEAGDGVYGYQLAPQADPTLLRLDWSGTVGGVALTVSTWVEILGAHLFTIPELRALKVASGQPFALTSTPLFTDAQLMDARAATLDEFEQILGFSPVPRFAREVVDGDGLWSVILPHLHCHRLLSVTVGGVAQSVASYTLRASGILESTSNYVASGTFTTGRQNVICEYVHGWPRVQGDGGNVAILRAAMRLQPGLGSTASQVVTPDGTSYSYDPAGQVTQAGTVRHFGVPAIDSWLNRWSQAGLAVA